MTYKESLMLIGDEWATLSDDKKIEVLQSIENHMAFESNRMSVPVEGKFLYTGTDGIVLGEYDPGKGCIYVNTSQFDSESMYGKDSSTLVTTCLHEGRHAYQHQVANGTVAHDNLEEAEVWRENLNGENYISFEDNPRGYFEQPVEVDARDFASNRYNELLSERQVEIEHQTDYHCAKNVFEEQISNAENGESNLAADYHQVDDLNKSQELSSVANTEETIHQ
ncbi:MAG: hypothetical protein E7571_00290 [Ruminococcaceae bacterium]|nr:hypothetical protein [Oscillospiraceae bacterium]